MRVLLILILITPLLAVSSTFKELEKKLKEVKSVRVVFVQKTRYSWYPKPELSKGVFYATKDGKFRIEYTYPDRVVMVSTGKEIIILNKEDREAIIDSTENNTSPVIESLFFFSKPLGEVFEAVGEMEKGGLRVLILRPKRKDENIKEVYVEVDERLDIRRIRVVDSEGTQTTIEFIDVRKNFRPSSGLFRLELPPDVKVRKAGKL
ncbi:outer membrane lipoprotein carrier protein LolA [Hydrogenivirga sp.]